MESALRTQIHPNFTIVLSQLSEGRDGVRKDEMRVPDTFQLGAIPAFFDF
jgi:hypothetical protein